MGGEISTNTNSLTVTSSQYEDTASILANIDDALAETNISNKTVISAKSRNSILSQQGYNNPVPYEPHTPVVQYQQTSSTQYVRVFTENHKYGKWLMKYSDIEGLTPSQIQSKFVLQNPPTRYCFVDVPSGTTMYTGVVNQSSIHGTLQYELGNTISSSAFGTDFLLP